MAAGRGCRGIPDIRLFRGNRPCTDAGQDRADHVHARRLPGRRLPLHCPADLLHGHLRQCCRRIQRGRRRRLSPERAVSGRRDRLATPASRTAGAGDSGQWPVVSNAQNAARGGVLHYRRPARLRQCGCRTAAGRAGRVVSGGSKWPRALPAEFSGMCKINLKFEAFGGMIEVTPDFRHLSLKRRTIRHGAVFQFYCQSL